jgi:hypothetical protein
MVIVGGRHACVQLLPLTLSTEPVFSLCSLAGRYVRKGCRSGPPGWESTPRLLKRFTNTGSAVNVPMFNDDISNSIFHV